MMKDDEQDCTTALELNCTTLWDDKACDEVVSKLKMNDEEI